MAAISARVPHADVLAAHLPVHGRDPRPPLARLSQATRLRVDGGPGQATIVVRWQPEQSGAGALVGRREAAGRGEVGIHQHHALQQRVELRQVQRG
jgi:hypothetical protein